jgi:alkaline phosphatase D
VGPASSGRRLFLRDAAVGASALGAAVLGASVGGLGAVAGCADEAPAEAVRVEPIDLSPGRWPALEATPFGLGVASGDPTPSAVIVWTRLYDAAARRAPRSDDEYVVLEVARDAAFEDLIRRELLVARARDGHALKHDVDGLLPGRTYHYRFRYGSWTSPAGRTRTLPAPDAQVDRFRFAFASCQKTSDGYYTAHHHLAAEDLDLVVFLGDYIYESIDDAPFAPERAQTYRVEDLAGYRDRYALARLDPDLQAAHAAFPWVVTWDDHEIENDYSGPHRNGTEPPTEAWAARRAAAAQAYWEHMPLRVPPPVGERLYLHRRVDVGRLLSLHVLDARQYRDVTACGGDAGFACPERLEPGRSILGAAQRAWLLDGLAAQRARWPVIASSVVFSRIDFGGAGANFDQWDGWVADQDTVSEALARFSNALVISGDIHMPMAANVARTREPGAPIVAAELTCPSVCSGGDEDVSRGLAPLIEGLDSVEYIAGDVRGYVRVDVTPTQMIADVRRVSTVLSPTAEVKTERRFRLEHDSPGLVAERVPG